MNASMRFVSESLGDEDHKGFQDQGVEDQGVDTMRDACEGKGRGWVNDEGIAW